MKKYLGKRIIQAFIAIIGITLVVFLVLHVAGDSVTLMLPPNASFEEIEALKEKLGYDDPIIIQYFRFLGNAVRGDFGLSYNYREPALSVVLERVPATVTLAVTAFVIAILVSIPAGIIAAVKRNTFIDSVIRTFALLGQCVPAFWLGIMLMLLFSVKLNLLPTSGFESWSSLILPATTLGLFSSATFTRILRSNMIEVMSREYIDTARSKGLSNFIVIMKHAFKNALSSLLTVMGLQIAGLLGGAVITETVFGWPGIGRLLVQSINNSDFNVVEVIVIFMATSFVVINLLVDILYSVINPRIKLQ